ncbi:unnamed protein product [Adineta steineri]|uniref:Uncharacterized protein n=1 Tax=Adineta steineri TaxID=433720 RepID=A0A815MR57_9BILA|nr:unnamed protein product [Adineta steineri]CAF3971192.1 unnamed protein product [Adineta steineri]
MMNSTISSHQIISSNLIISKLTPVAYDTTGAILFIIVVLFWYSMGIICMLGMQIKARNETVEDYARRRAKLLIETLRDQTHTKQILEELVDKQKRDKLWDIYLGTSDNNNDKLIRAEVLRIRNIEKQLAVINKNHLCMNESLMFSTKHSDSQSMISSDLTSTENRVRIRRRSSLDQQIIERWKNIVEQCIKHEQLPWTIQKLMIRRHFRRHYKDMLRQTEPRNISMHNKQYHSVQNSPILNVKPNHHIIQLDNDEYD